MSKDDSPPEGSPREDVVSLFQRGLRFTEELLAENERLRFQLASMSPGTSTSTPAEGADEIIEALKKQVADLEAERTRLLDSFKAVEEKNRDYQERYAEIEEEHNNLANLYIASYQLHSTLSFVEVVRIITEIVINLVGVQQFCLLLKEAGSDKLTPVACEGIELGEAPSATIGEGTVGEAVAQEKLWVREAGQTEAPCAVVPLTTLEGAFGVIVIEELLVQKPEFTRVDHELFRLLGAHAATALQGALLRERSGSPLDGVTAEEVASLK
jgi:nitrate/nitrite-specific signal transduction histidine kinase